LHLRRHGRSVVLQLGISIFLASLCFGQELTITSPISGTIWVGGTTHEITWTGATSDSVSIELFWRGSLDEIIVESTPNDGSFTWTVPDWGTDIYNIIIRGENESDITGFYLENSAGGIYISSPTWDDTWQMGSTYEITWTDNISENVRIDLYYSETSDSPAFPKGVITSSTPSDGSYLWTIPSDLPPEIYQLRMQSVSASSTSVFSRTFYIVEQSTSCEDSYEPNDAIESPSKFAFSSAIGGNYYQTESIEGTLHLSGDWDHYRLNIEAPGSLNITLSNVPDGFDLQLYNNESDGYVTGSFTAGDENISVEIDSTGFYYIIVGSLEGTYNCSPYILSVDWAADLFLEVNTPSREVGSAPGTITFDVSSNANWSVSEDASWLSVDKTSSELMTVTFDENVTTENRSAIVTLSADGVPSKNVTVTQAGIICSLIVTPEIRIIGSGAGTTNVAVTSNVTWSVNESAEWLSASADGNTISIAYDANESIESRSTVITVTGDACADTAIVEQNGVQPLFEVSTDPIQLGAEKGAMATFQITSNVDWSIDKSRSWLEVDPATGTGIAQVRVDALQSNSTGATRSDTLLVTGYGTTYLVVVTQDYITSIQERTDPGLHLYPNPTFGQLNIETGTSDLKNIQITTMNGQNIFSDELKGNTFQLDLSSFQKGVYFITIRSKDFVSKRLIIKL